MKNFNWLGNKSYPIVCKTNLLLIMRLTVFYIFFLDF